MSQDKKNIWVESALTKLLKFISCKKKEEVKVQYLFIIYFILKKKHSTFY